MKAKHKKLKNIYKIVIAIISILIVVGLIIAGCIFNEWRFKSWENNYNSLVIEVNNKQTTIEELNKELEKLKKEQKNIKKKQDSLKNEVKEIRTSKEKQKAVTSRGSSPVSSRQTSTSNGQWMWANASAYCACVQCCGKTNAVTASGKKAKANHTIAAPSIYKFGTQIEIEGMGIYTVEDRGGAITGNKIDIFFNSHSEALKFGRRQLKIRVIK